MRGEVQRQRIGVIGAGIVGSSIAYHLARRGAEVTVFEQNRPGAGATSDSFAWINATFDKQPRTYYELNRRGMRGYRALVETIEGLEVDWGGTVEWVADATRADRLLEQIASHRSWGYPVRAIDSDELGTLEPALIPGPVAAAVHCADEGSVDPVAATQAFLAAARAAGADLECPCKVVDIERRGESLRLRTDRGERLLDVVVIAAGTATVKAAAWAGLQVPLIDSPGALATSEPIEPCLRGVVLAPTAHIVQRADGRIVTGADFGGGPVDGSAAEQGQVLLAEAARYLRPLGAAKLDRLSIGWRPMARDGLPIVGFAAGAPGVYLAVTHSGVTLAPILGRLAAREILDGVEAEALKDFRLARFG